MVGRRGIKSSIYGIKSYMPVGSARQHPQTARSYGCEVISCVSRVKSEPFVEPHGTDPYSLDFQSSVMTSSTKVPNFLYVLSIFILFFNSGCCFITNFIFSLSFLHHHPFTSMKISYLTR